MVRRDAAAVPEPSGLLILGAGGHGRVVAEAAQLWRGPAVGFARIDLLDDDLSRPGVIGPLSRCSEPALRSAYGQAVVALGRASLRLQWLERLQQLGYSCPALVHPSASVSPMAQLGAGTVVLAQAAVITGARLGPGCIVNTAASVDHDCVLAAGVHVCPGAHLAGAVQVGPRSWIGIGASVIQGISIGADVTVGAGAAVVHDLADGLTVVGVPARPLPPTTQPLRQSEP